MISGREIVSVLWQLFVGGLIFGVLWWGQAKMGLKDPFGWLVRGILILLVVIFLVNLLLGLGGHPLVRW